MVKKLRLLIALLFTPEQAEQFRKRKAWLLAIFDPDRRWSELAGNSEGIQRPDHDHQAIDGGGSEGYFRELLATTACGFLTFCALLRDAPIPTTNCPLFL